MKKEEKMELRYFVEKESNILEQLEEMGSINTDNLECDLDLLLEVLEEDFNLPCSYQNVIGKHLLINEHFEENRR